MIQSAGREVLLRQIDAGEFFGELAAIDGQPRSSGIVATTDVTIARMPASVFRAAIHAHADLCDKLLRILAGQIRILANRVNEFSTLDVRYRIYAELLRLSRPDPSNAGRATISPPRARGNRRAGQHATRDCCARTQGTGTSRPHRASPGCDCVERHGPPETPRRGGHQGGLASRGKINAHCSSTASNCRPSRRSCRGCHPASLPGSNRAMKPISAAIARPRSRGLAYSIGLWLTPPRQRTNSIPIGQSFAIACPS